MSKPKLYLGDGAYVEFTGYNFRLYTSNGIEETNEIFLEVDHFVALKDFIHRVTANQSDNSNYEGVN